jgi:hypothetical protein
MAKLTSREFRKQLNKQDKPKRIRIEIYYRNNSEDKDDGHYTIVLPAEYKLHQAFHMVLDWKKNEYVVHMECPYSKTPYLPRKLVWIPWSSVDRIDVNPEY